MTIMPDNAVHIEKLETLMPLIPKMKFRAFKDNYGKMI